MSDVNAASATLAGTITAVDVTNYTTLSISDNALTTLALTGGSGNVQIGNGNLTTATNTTLAATLNSLTGGSLIDSGVYTAMNVATTGANSRLANISMAALTALTVAGDRRLTLTSTAGLAALSTLAVTGAAGVIADFSGSTLRSIDTTGTTGNSIITMNGSLASFAGGAGVDNVTATSNAVGKVINLGNGDDSFSFGSGSSTPTAAVSGGGGIDTLTMTASFAATASSTIGFRNVVTGFEQLVLTGATNQTVNLANIGINNLISTSGGNGLTLADVHNGGTLVLTGAGTAYTITNTAFASGLNDTINLTLVADNSGAGTNFAATGITAANVENLVITMVDTQATPGGFNNDAITLLGNTAKTVTLNGNAGLNLTMTDTALTSVNAAGITLGGFVFNAGALAAAAAISGSATGTNTVNFSAATGVVTYTGGAGDDTVDGINANNNLAALGNGTNDYGGGNGNQTITAGTGTDTVFLGSGNNTVSLGNGTNSFTASSGNNTYTGGTGVDSVHLGSGINSVTLGAGANLLDLTAADATNSFTTVLDPIAGDTIRFLDKGTEAFNSTQVTLSPGALLQQFADAVVVAGGDSSTNGHFGWFQVGGNTFVVESQHNGTTTANFVDGTDVIVRLSGLVDLSTATLTGSSSLLLH